MRKPILSKPKWNELFHRRPSFYRKMIIFTLVASVIPVICLGIGSYLLASKAIKQEVSKSNVRILNNASLTINKTLELIENNVMQLALSSFFASNPQELKSNNYAGFYSNVFRNLSAYKNGNKEILDISLYTLDEHNLISASYGGVRLDNEADRQHYANLMESDRQLFWENGYTANGVTSPYGVTLYCKLPLNTNEPVGLLQVNIDNSMFQRLSSSYTNYEGERMFVLDERNTMVFYSAADRAVPEGLFEAAGLHSAGERFTFKWNDMEYLVTTKLSSHNKWNYIDMIPIAELNSSLNKISRFTVAIVAIVLLGGTVWVLLGTRRVYRPIEALVSQIRGNTPANLQSEAELDELSYVGSRWNELHSKASQLETQLNEQFPLLREIFALQLLEGQFVQYRGDYVQDMLRRYGIPGQQYGMAFIMAYDHLPDEGRFSDKDKDLIVFTMKNIASELLQERQAEGITINSLNDQVTVWVWTEHGQSETWESDVQSTVELIRSFISDYLRLPVTVGLGRTVDRVEELPESYQEAKLAVRSRIIDGGNRVIESKGMTNPLHYRYPIEVESHFTNSLQLGDLAEAERMLETFSHKVQTAIHNPELIQMSYDQLLTTLIRTAYLLSVSTEALFGAEGSDPYAEMRQCSTIPEFNAWFMKRLVSPIIASVQGKKQQENDLLIGKVTEFIEANYHLDISLDQCAQLCGISPQYLSRLFKRKMEISFIEYITKYRIEKAVLFLETTNLSVTDISEKVGYQPKNFIRVFKKHTGMPPGQYRERNR